MFKIEDYLAFITNQSGKLFSEALERDLRPYGVTRSQWIALYFIHETPLITQRQLAERMAIKEPSVVRLIQKMESDNYLIRVPDESDKRNKQLKLTDKGNKTCLTLLPVAEAFKDNTIRGISQEDLSTVMRVLNQMVDNASEEDKQENIS
ncbi:MarR family transcriptional regulator [Companilactobacillus sp.]|uniref:MarR family winged helix-turn-helix transcriptional regulator n=1 Tax=Companilactobacillus sp. TaxID=2767905 RepID=UPI0026079042|nr:MarR family transcriptional regulator [Companilactobacillus sp.]